MHLKEDTVFDLLNLTLGSISHKMLPSTHYIMHVTYAASKFRVVKTNGLQENTLFDL